MNTIRLAKDDDLETILEIWKEGWLAVNPEIEITEEAIEIFKTNYKNRNSGFNFWVVEKNNEIIAWCSLLPAFSHPIKKLNNAEISVYINLAHRRNGIGIDLMRYVFKVSANSDFKTIWGFVKKNNFASLKISEAAGMQICGQTEEKVILIKKLQ